jgi:hypothetical protein
MFSGRQRNLVPSDIARNEGNFLGALIIGPPHPTNVQRIGMVFLGLLFLSLGVLGLVMMVVFPTGLLIHGTSGSLVYAALSVFRDLFSLVVAVGSLILGFRITRNAISDRGSSGSPR